MKTGSSVVMIGDIAIGGDNPIMVQSMTNTNTNDTIASSNQIERIYSAGCEIVRLSCKDFKEAENLTNIKDNLIAKGINIPLVADVHFSSRIAEVAAKHAKKVRINPGNYIDKRRSKTDFTDEDDRIHQQKILEKIKPLVDVCIHHGTSIRIGINHGSLSERILFKFGNTAQGMLASALEFVEIFRKFDFHNFIISMKASHVPTMIKANKLLVAEMKNRGYSYPLHLGVTEAGDGDYARVKAACGIGSLLAENIGDTIRVSLTEAPEKEVVFANQLVKIYGQRNDISAEINHKRKDEKSVVIEYYGLDYIDLLIRASVDFTLLQSSYGFTSLEIKNNNELYPELSDIILQALGLKYTIAEFIACPSCGRTLFNIEEELRKVKEKTNHLKGLKIAVMGCIVNGIGEMADADYGYIGAGAGKVNLYKGKTLTLKNLNVETAVDSLVELIKNNNDWK